MGDLADSMSDVIMNDVALPLPLAMKSWYESRPASGTPMKFTRSLPAKAMARANVPISTTSLNTLTRSRWITSITMVEPMKVQKSRMLVFSSIHALDPADTSGDLARPWMKMK